MSKKELKKNWKEVFEKIVVNSGIGRMSVSTPNFEEKLLGEIMQDFATISGQKPSTRTASKSIAGFKLRTGNIVGIKSTLRGARMIDFLNKVVKIVLPRLRDFRGISENNIDSNGNLSIGLKEHIVFPEINQETSKVNFGLQITIVPKIKNREASLVAYKEFGVPFQKSL